MSKGGVNASRAGKKRRMTGWTLLTLGVIVTGVWVLSGWRELWCGYGVLDVRVEPGEVRLAWDRPVMKSFAWEVTSASLSPGPGWKMWYGWGTETVASRSRLIGGVVCIRHTAGKPWGAQVLLWPIPLLLWVPAALLLRSGVLARRREMGSQCKACGYDLAGLASGVKCPECGKRAKAVP